MGTKTLEATMADDLKHTGRHDRRRRTARLRVLMDELGITSPKAPDYRRSNVKRVKNYRADQRARRLME